MKPTAVLNRQLYAGASQYRLCVPMPLVGELDLMLIEIKSFFRYTGSYRLGRVKQKLAPNMAGHPLCSVVATVWLGVGSDPKLLEQKAPSISPGWLPSLCCFRVSCLVVSNSLKPHGL